MNVCLDYESLPVVDGVCVDVSVDNFTIGSMVWSEDLNQWNDTQFPGDVADKSAEVCAVEMIRFRKELLG
jgi:hypothetical protein